MKSKVYTGEILTADNPNNDLYEMAKNDGGVDVGEYDVELKLKDSVNYKWKDGNNIVKFKITKATPSISTKPTGKTLKYNKKQQELVTAGETNGGTLYYKLGDNSEWSENIPTAKAVGTYKIYYYVKGDKNHNDYYPETNYVEATIGKDIPNVTVTPVSNLTYNGSNQNLISNVDAPEGVTVQYKDNNGNWSTTIPTAKNAGTYTVYYKAIGGEQYSDVAEQSISVKIKPKSITVSNIKANNKVYDGTTHATLDFKDVTFDGKCGNDQLSITAKGEFKNANAGKREVTLTNLTLTGKDKDNYELAQTGNQTTTTATITPKSITSAIVTLNGENNTYMFNNRNAITPNVTVKDGEKPLGSNDFELTGNTSATDYGTYTLNVEGKGNYQGTIPVKWKIDENIAPTGTIKIGNNTINKVLNTLTFGHFFKETKTVTIIGEDGEGQSGVKKVFYYLSDNVLSINKLKDVNWTEGDSVSINPNNKYVIYAKIVDEAGNSCVVNSDGIVLYSDSSQATTNLEYTKTTKNNLQAIVNLNGNTIKDIFVDNAKLSTDNYTVDQGTVTFKGEWLDTLVAGEHVLTVSYNPLGEEYVDNTNNQAPSTTQITLNVLKTNAGLEVKKVGTKSYGDNSFKLNVNHKGNGQLNYTSSNEEVATVDNQGNVTIKGAGKTTLKVTLETDQNYDGDSKEVLLIVNKINHKLEIKEADIEKTYGDKDFKIYATSNDSESPIEYASSNENVVTVDKQGKVTVKGTGKAIIKVSQKESKNYNEVSKEVNLIVKAKKITVTVDDKEKVYLEKDKELTYTCDGLVENDKLTDIILSRKEGEDVGTYKIMASQKEGSNPNYDITFKDGEYTIKALAIDQGMVILGKVLKYTGKNQKQEVENVLVNGKILSKDDYEVVDNQAAKEGKHVLTIKSKGNNCTGSFEYNYVILPEENSKIGTGSFTVKTTGDVEINRDELIDLLIENKIITANELSEVSQGKKVEIVLDVKDGETDKTIENNTAGYKVGKYLDITLYKNVDGTNENIHKLSKVLKIMLTLSKEQINKDSTIKREYYIARDHDGKVDILEAKYDDKKNILMFETDRFSDYAILYKDTQVNQENIQVTKTQELKTKEKVKKVKTGDDTNIIGLTVLLLCSLGVLVFVRRKEEKNQ